MPQRTQPPERSGDAATSRGPAIYRVEHTFGRIGLLVGAIHPAVKALEPWGILLAVVAFSIDYEDRRQDRIDRREERIDRQAERVAREEGRRVNAWQLLTTPASGNSGKIHALDYLNDQDVPLVGIDLSPPEPDNGTPDNPDDDPQGAYLRDVKLPGAVLRSAKLSRADLSGADLRFASLSGANLHRANLWGADLSDANLSGANLSGANLLGANLLGATLYSADLTGAGLLDSDLSDADLSGAKLSGAKLSGAILGLSFVDMDARNLTQAQLDEACGDEKTELPEGLTIPMCEK
ncbi:MAG: pentapeptide repeat-containing protein [Geminicoccaceae bacterium]